MAKPRPDSKRLPVYYPSVPDSESKPGEFNESAVAVKPDRMPEGRMGQGYGESRADLRIRLEQLLQRRDSVSLDAWSALGEDGRALLVELLDDEAICSNEALRHRVIAILGQLAVKRGVAPLSAVLTSRAESSLTKAYAATALGHIGESSAIPALAAAMTEKDEMVRRQVAKSLTRLDRAESIPHLLKLRDDPSIAVAEVASEALRGWETKLGQRLGKARKLPARKAAKKKVHPAAER